MMSENEEGDLIMVQFDAHPLYLQMTIHVNGSPLSTERVPWGKLEQIRNEATELYYSKHESFNDAEVN